jgi:hypothetical protein
LVVLSAVTPGSRGATGVGFGLDELLVEEDLGAASVDFESGVPLLRFIVGLGTIISGNAEARTARATTSTKERMVRQWSISRFYGHCKSRWAKIIKDWMGSADVRNALLGVPESNEER